MPIFTYALKTWVESLAPGLTFPNAKIYIYHLRHRRTTITHCALFFFCLHNTVIHFLTLSLTASAFGRTLACQFRLMMRIANSIDIMMNTYWNTAKAYHRKKRETPHHQGKILLRVFSLLPLFSPILFI